MSKMYALEQSPLYRMRNKKKLATLLGISTNYLMQEHGQDYYKFSRPKPNGDGTRNFTVPSDELKYAQKKLCRLLSRIQTPDWVISGKKNHSYITNAEKHIENTFVKTMDISKFYDSSERKYVYRMFKETFKMAEDIAWLMTELVMYENMLPTGSPSSQLIVYWAYCDMFNEINQIANERACIFTLYVDDMTFSSKTPITKELRQEVCNQLKKYGLIAKSKKDHYYQGNTVKVITGVGINDGQKVVLNNKRKRILEQFEKCKTSNKIYDIEKLNGMLCALRQIEPEIFPEIYNYIKHYDSELKLMARNRFFKHRRKRRKIEKQRQYINQNNI
ncbi:MAG: RNA-directed DNA polymerase [Clostridia bacterium]|nr:RNA-directed DNA polymerase [Clostridia bacterium]